MAETLSADLCVIGGGPGGLSVAAGAARLGASVVLFERRRMGGDCLNFGCVPSKALIAAANTAHAIATADRFGIDAGVPEVDFARVMAHVRGVIEAVAPHDSEERFTGLGVRVIRSAARFVGPREIAADGVTVKTRRTVVATGSSPVVPPVPGLAELPVLTNETVFDLDVRPDHLLILGGGPIGVELAQAFRRLGAAVTIVERDRILPRDDAELVDILRERLRFEGVDIREGAEVRRAERRGNRVALVLGDGTSVEGSHLLAAAGRRPTLDGLDLERAGIRHDGAGIRVDSRLRTSNRSAFAIGDVAALDGVPFRFTHVAGHHAGVVLRNALFGLPARVDHRFVPWVTYADPEFAHVGETEAAVRQTGREVTVVRWPFAQNDRAHAERATEGLIKVVVGSRGRIRGVSILGAQAGELIQPWVLALQRGLSIKAVAEMIAPYPTRGEVGKRVAGLYFEPWLFSERTRRIVRFLARFR